MDILQWLDYLNEVIENATEIPITGKIVLHKKDTLELIKKILHALPDELKRSKWIISERDRIIGEAKKFSEDSMREAKMRLDRKIEESQIVVAAQQESKNILDNAKLEAKAIKCGANDYIKEVLKALYEDLENDRKDALKMFEEVHNKNAQEIVKAYKNVEDKIKFDLGNVK